MKHGNPITLGANGTATFSGSCFCRFLCTVAGTITITDQKGNTLVNAFPVAAGDWPEFYMYVQGRQGTITLGGGAAGTAIVS